MSWKGIHKAGLRDFLDALDAVRIPGAEELPLLIARLQEATHATLFKLEREEEASGIRIAAIFGPSGAGKSSLFNQLTEGAHSHTSSIERPATRGAVCALPAAGAPELAARLFPTLARTERGDGAVRGQTGEVTFLDGLSEDHLILVDCPDYDTRHDMNREVSRRIFSWADVVVFVTSSERYADRSTAAEFEVLKAERMPVIAVLNRVRGDHEELSASLTRELERIQVHPIRMVTISEAEHGMPEDAAFLDALRSELAGLAARIEVDTEPVARALRREVLPLLRIWRNQCRALSEDLDATRESTRELRSEQAVGALETIEEANKFWLRYSPRGVLKGLRTVLARPGSLFRSDTAPKNLAESELSGMVQDQAWEHFESFQIRAREVMQRHTPGRVLLGSQCEVATTDMSRDDCVARFRALGDRLGEFGRSRLERARREWNDHKKGPLARAQFWALDKVLRLLTLGLTLAVLPPLVWELLRFIGHPSFTNEVTAEFQQAKADFQHTMDQLIDEQLQAYARKLDELGTSEETAVALERFADQLGGTAENVA